MANMDATFIDAAEATVRQSRVSASVGDFVGLGAYKHLANVPILSYEGATYDGGGLLLNGDVPVLGKRLPPEYDYLVVLDRLSDAQGNFSEPISYELLTTCSKSGDKEINIVFDPIRKQYAKKFTVIVATDSGDKSTSYLNNNSVAVTISVPKASIQKITINIYSWSVPKARPRIRLVDIAIGQSFQVAEEGVIDFSATVEADSKIERYVLSTARLKILDEKKKLYKKTVAGRRANITYSFRKPYGIKRTLSGLFFIKKPKWKNNILTLELNHPITKIQDTTLPVNINDYREISARDYMRKLNSCTSLGTKICYCPEDIPAGNICAAVEDRSMATSLLYIAEWACCPIQALLSGREEGYHIWMKPLDTSTRNIEMTNNHYLEPTSVDTDTEKIGGIDVAMFEYDWEAQEIKLAERTVGVHGLTRTFLKLSKPALNVRYTCEGKMGDWHIVSATAGATGVEFVLDGDHAFCTLRAYGQPLIEAYKYYYSLDVPGATSGGKRITVDNPFVIDSGAARRIAEYKLARYAETNRIKTTVPGRVDLEMLEKYRVTMPDDTVSTARLEKSEIAYNSSGFSMTQEAVI